MHDVSLILQAPSNLFFCKVELLMGKQPIILAIRFQMQGLPNFRHAIWANNGTYKPTGYFWDMWPAPAPPTPPGIGIYNAPGPFGPQTATLASTFNGL